MIKLFSTCTMYNPDDYMEGGYDTTTVQLTRREARLLKAHDEETEYNLFDTGEVRQSYYGGPGRAFIHAPSYHIEWKRIYLRPVAVITQHFGFDI